MHKMELYDNYLYDIEEMLKPYIGKKLRVMNEPEWPDTGDRNMILKSEMAYELGGSDLPAVSGIGYTDSIQEDELWLYGCDLSEIDGDHAYARVVMANVDTGKMGTREEIQETYTLLRKVEYKRYHVNPEGYMMRISAAGSREPVRVGKRSMAEGLTLERVGNLFIKKYKEQPYVKAVKLIFITEADFPYDMLAEKVMQIENITNSLNYIFNNLKMDCTTCIQKPVCDEVDGLRKLHFKEIGGRS